MINERTERFLKESEGLFRRLDRIEKFSGRYGLVPSRETTSVICDMNAVAGRISSEVTPQNQDQLMLAELKRRLIGQAAHLEQQLSGRLYSFDKVIQLLGIPREDIDSLKPWLLENKGRTEEAVERLFNSRDVEGYELPLAADIPQVGRQVEGFAGEHIQRYHKTLGQFLGNLTEVGGLLLQRVSAVPTTQDRSYFHPLTENLAISISGICFSREDGTLRIREGELIKKYGHEGMGHALNFVLTRSSNLPYFLANGSALTLSTAESVAQFYENVLMEDLRKSPETQRKLGIEHKFAEIYQEAKDTEQLNDYQHRMTQYIIAVLADRRLGNPGKPKVIKKKIEILSNVAIDKSAVAHAVQQNRYSFDTEGNLSPQLVSELRYCAKPVQRAMAEFNRRGVRYEDKEGRSLIDRTFLRGFWTPIGFVDNARICARYK